MPLTLTEKLDSRKWNTGDNASVEMVYVLTSTSDDVTAKTLVANSTGTEYHGLVRQSINLLRLTGFHKPEGLKEDSRGRKPPVGMEFGDQPRRGSRGMGMWASGSFSFLPPRRGLACNTQSSRGLRPRADSARPCGP